MTFARGPIHTRKIETPRAPQPAQNYIGHNAFDEMDETPEGICKVCGNIIQEQSINGCCVECY